MYTAIAAVQTKCAQPVALPALVVHASVATQASAQQYITQIRSHTRQVQYSHQLRLLRMPTARAHRWSEETVCPAWWLLLRFLARLLCAELSHECKECTEIATAQTDIAERLRALLSLVLGSCMLGFMQHSVGAVNY
eukprot:12768-Heterococcus_DN1.PRE.2